MPSSSAVSPEDSVVWATHTGGVGGPVLRYDPVTKTWTTTLTGCRDPSVVDFDDGGNIYVYCASTKNFRRSTNGTSFEVIGQLCGGDTVIGGGLSGSLSVHRSGGQRMYAIHHSLDGTYTCRSDNGGVAWSELELAAIGSTFLHVRVSQADPQDVVRTGKEVSCQYVQRSTDGGTTWSSRVLVTSSSNPCCLACSPSNPAVILYGASNGLFKSTVV